MQDVEVPEPSAAIVEDPEYGKECVGESAEYRNRYDSGVDTKKSSKALHARASKVRNAWGTLE